MGWTHDYGDAARKNPTSATAPITYPRGGVPQIGTAVHDQRLGLGIPRIIRRRARWVSARLRHQRGGSAARAGTGT
ncbi:hypothetical protein [Streptomyces sp. 8L]|uniref:hypothetical protein n=1 Tax=Streptomyces sp. 8L TaxID=2877242 RepID=UPI001CD533DF|nr:hypothetical protein [Streptomyces sp. 8L]MCA1222663.1 hypothetical protein [Streptomyces sp. 8L]